MNERAFNLFAIFDRKSGQHFGIAVFPNAEVFKRSLQPEVNDTNPRNLLAHCSSDYELFALGFLDEKSGIIDPCRTFICNLSELKEV